MASSVYFNGELITIPGAYSMTDASGMSTKSDGDGAKIIAFIGEYTGGEPDSNIGFCVTFLVLAITN